MRSLAASGRFTAAKVERIGRWEYLFVIKKKYCVIYLAYSSSK